MPSVLVDGTSPAQRDARNRFCCSCSIASPHALIEIRMTTWSMASVCAIIPFFSQRGASGLRGRPWRTVNQLSLRIASGNAIWSRIGYSASRVYASGQILNTVSASQPKFGDKGEMP